jgi:uncharacterized protein with NAD-binding domain and iron-sulfur cluster
MILLHPFFSSTIFHPDLFADSYCSLFRLFRPVPTLITKQSTNEASQQFSSPTQESFSRTDQPTDRPTNLPHVSIVSADNLDRQ